MEILIKIPREMYATLNNIPMGKISVLDALYAIKNGTPLPKGHGRLIDADEEIKKFCGKVCGHTLEKCGYGFYCPLVQRMKSAPAIIEADKEQET